MRRRLFIIASGVSLLLCAATVVLWMRSYFTLDNWQFVAMNRYIAESDSGRLEMSVQRRVVDTLDGFPDLYQPFIPIVLRDGHPKPFSQHWLWTHEGAMPGAESNLFADVGVNYPENWAGFGWGEMPEVLDVSEAPPPSNGGCVMSVSVTRFLVMPHWFLFSLTAILPLCHGTRWLGRLRRRRHAGFCPACGYNLTGNTSGVCPECGMATTGR